MTIRTRKPTPSYKDYSRKPYMEGDENDYREMMTAVPNKAMINQRYEPQSEFLKPYLSDVPYSEMEHFYPPPFTNFAWPNWKFPEFSGPVPEDGEWEGDAGGEFGDRDTPRNPCSFSLRQQYCSQVKAAGLDVADAAVSGTKMPGGKYPYNAATHFWSFEGVGKHLITNIRESPPMIRSNPFLDYSPQALSHSIHFNWDTVKAKGSDTCYVATTLCYNIRGVCKHCVDVFDSNCCETCCGEDEPPEGVFTFDDPNTPDTIVAGDYISVYVTGGCAPFTYAVTGTGYTWNGNGTASYESSNRDEQLDCADGT